MISTITTGLALSVGAVTVATLLLALLLPLSFVLETYGRIKPAPEVVSNHNP